MLQCRICGNSAFNTEYQIKEMMYGLDEKFSYFQCSKCACLQVSSVPQNLPRYYGSDYYSFGAPPQRTGLMAYLYRKRDGYAFTNQGWIGRLLNTLYPKIEYRFLSRLELPKSARILDVGCGAGYLLQAMQRAGFQQLTGVDPFIDTDIRYPNDVTIYKTTIDCYSKPQDVVMFNHALEHMPDQQFALKCAADLVVQDGVVIARVPTVSSFAWQHYGVDWVQLDAPRHLFLHSYESMSIAASQAGLEVFDVLYDSESFQFWGSEQCKKGIPLLSERSYAKNPHKSLFSADEITRFQTRAAKLNHEGAGDQAAFFMRRKAGTRSHQNSAGIP